MVHIWDIIIRVFHMLLVYAMIGAYVTSENDAIERHALWGITIIALLVCRILWGFCGSYNARFKNFLYAPRIVIDYLKNFFTARASHYMGHNPVGAVSVIVMMFLLLLQSLSGLTMTDDIFFEGPFYPLLSQDLLSLFDMIHRQNFNILICVIFTHVAAVFYYLFYKKDNLITPMISGQKNITEDNKAHIGYAAYSKISAVICILCAGVTWFALYNITDI